MLVKRIFGDRKVQNQLSIRYTKACGLVNKDFALMKATERIRVTKALLQLDSERRQGFRVCLVRSRRNLHACSIVVRAAMSALERARLLKANERPSMVSECLSRRVVADSSVERDL